jgi:hypothetical protein
MKIKFKNFTLQPGQTAKDRFDVLQTKEVKMNNTPSMIKKWGKNVPIGTIVGTKEDELAYDMLLENAIQKIVLYELSENESVTDLQGFIAEYKKTRAEIESLLK